jgi:mRNA interferase RelE/StbE
LRPQVRVALGRQRRYPPHISAARSSPSLGLRTPDSPKKSLSTAKVINGNTFASSARIGKPLREELAGVWSARLGTERRVVYRIDESKHSVAVEDIQHRSTVYRRR